MTKLCLIAGNYDQAWKFAQGQNLPDNSWFYPKDVNELLFRTNFYVLVIGTAGQNIPSRIFEELYTLAQNRGKIDRF